MNEKYVEFFLNARASVVRVECLEISHTHFSRVFRVVRNATDGITVKHEDGQEYFYEYYPLQIENLGATDDMDSGLKINLGDLGKLIPDEIDRVMTNDGMLEKPVVRYRLYRSDDLERPMFGPIEVEIKPVSFTSEGATFEAKAPSVNVTGTGEVYSLDAYPSLRGFL